MWAVARWKLSFAGWKVRRAVLGSAACPRGPRSRREHLEIRAGAARGWAFRDWAQAGAAGAHAALKGNGGDRGDRDYIRHAVRCEAGGAAGGKVTGRRLY
jgi:hypothetical protein